MSDDENDRHSAVEETKIGERPFWRRSGLWKREAEIRKLIADGYSYEQVRRVLGLRVTARQVGNFCVKQLGIRSRGGTKQCRMAGVGGTGQVSDSGQSTRRGRPSGKRLQVGTQPQESAPAPAPNVASIAEALGPNPGEWLNQYRAKQEK